MKANPEKQLSWLTVLTVALLFISLHVVIQTSPRGWGASVFSTFLHLLLRICFETHFTECKVRIKMCQMKNTFCDNILTSMHYYDFNTRVRHSGITMTPPCPGQALLARSFNPCPSSFPLHGVIQIHSHEWGTKNGANFSHL